MSDAPFLELADRDPGNDAGLWARQLLALKVLERVGSDRLEAVRGRLGDHPSAEVRRWLDDQKVAGTRERLVTERGDVELMRIVGGSFEMGSAKLENGSSDEERPRHRVTVSAFAIGRYPVTNEEYARFLEANPGVGEPEYWGDRAFNQARQPVVGVSWEDARRFSHWAGGRLPTEAEWEYSARAGTTAPYVVGSTIADLHRVAWHGLNSQGRPHPVGQKEPNAWGLYDVLGNVVEWVEDDWHHSYEGAPDNGSPWMDEPRDRCRVLRGGAYPNFGWNVRAAVRFWLTPINRKNYVGFRVAGSPDSFRSLTSLISKL